jgi:hypothetical protein
MSKQRGKLVLSSVEKEQLRQLIRAQSASARVGAESASRTVDRSRNGGSGPSESRSAGTLTRSPSGDGAISEAGLERCRMSRARAAKATLARRSCARSSIKTRGHRRAGGDGLAARLLASQESPMRPCSGSGVRTKSSRT